MPDDRVPPGQALTRKYPVVGEKAPAPEALDLEHWRLIVEGLIDPAFEITLDEFLSLPQRDLMADIHCVTGWTQLGMRFTGLPLQKRQMGAPDRIPGGGPSRVLGAGVELSQPRRSLAGE
jgi:DMSO/TMAO reductase YedYZ molybdopterin-dependent catalytic subunit